MYGEAGEKKIDFGICSAFVPLLTRRKVENNKVTIIINLSSFMIRPF